MDKLAVAAGGVMTPYYQDDATTLYLGDCREVLATFPDASVDLVLTDPPYGHNNNDGDLAHHREKALGLSDSVQAGRPIAGDDPGEAADLVRWLFQESKRLLRDGSCCCCCCGGGGGPDPQFARWSLLMDDVLRFKQMVVWDKGGLGMGWHYRRNWECILVGQRGTGACRWYGGNNTPNLINWIPRLLPQAHHHPTEKPEALMAFFITLHSAPRDLVLDPFAGSGTTLVAAKRLGRRAVGVECDERWAEMAVARLRQESLFSAGAGAAPAPRGLPSTAAGETDG